MEEEQRGGSRHKASHSGKHRYLKLVCLRAEALRSCLTLSDPVGCSPPDSSVRGILQPRIPEWAAMPSSRGSSRPRG